VQFLRQAFNGLPVKGTWVGLVAGTGDFPLYVADAVRRSGYRLVTAAIERSDGALREQSDEFGEYGIGEGGRVLERLKKSGVRHVLLAGGLPKKKILEPSGAQEPDELTRSVLSKMNAKGDDALLRAVTAVLAANGIRVLDPAAFLKDRLTPRGVLTPNDLTASQKIDAQIGLKAARAIGRLDIGQTVVVKNGAVIAVEAVEGTDAVIRRVKELGIAGAVLVKASKPQQDLRFDMPVAGLKTVENARDAQIAAIALEAGKSLFLEREEAVKMAAAAGIALLGV